METRLLLTGNWHNTDLPCDVDESGLVTPRDALVVIGSLNSEGIRALLQEGTASTTQRKLDVTDDNRLTPRDALLVINVLNRALPDANIAFGLSPDSDPNSNGVVIRDQVTLRGEAGPNSRIMIELKKDTAPNSPEEFFSQADGEGNFTFDASLGSGTNRLTIQARDELGRSVTSLLEIRRGDQIADWNAAALNVIRDWTGVCNDPYQGRIVPSQPPMVARNLAMIHAAIFDAVNTVIGEYESYTTLMSTNADVSAIAAAATAAYRVASTLYTDTDEISVWDATLEESLSIVADDTAKQAGIQIGQQVADSILELRVNDGATVSVIYTPGTDPGDWNRTQPDGLPPMLPQWPNVKPFAIASGNAFRPSDPPELSSVEYAEAFEEVQRYGGLTGSQRSDEQTEIALYWADGGGTATPAGHWNRIASDAATKENLSLIESARLMALLNIAMADAGIASWDAKYAFSLWRPIDAIQKASLDGNSQTSPDGTWLPLIKTPPFPTYTSGHSTFSGAASTVLSATFGTNYAFSSDSDSHSGLNQRPLAESQVVTRHFESFEQAAAEAGQSRIYGGIHFQFDNAAGLAAGKQIGQFVSANLFKHI